jgi:hypothetical protein
MIKQVCTFHKDTYNLKSYKEFQHGKLIVHTEYDVNNNKTYFESNYGGEPRHWMKRKFDACSKNDDGNIIFYEDSNGLFRHIRHRGKRQIKIENRFTTQTKYDGKVIPYEIIDIKVGVKIEDLITDNVFTLIANREVGTNYFYAESYVENSKYFTLKYSRFRFEEIYYQDSNDNRIIHVDEAHRITEYKDLIDEFNIVMCSENYRPDSREFRKFIPIY